MSDVPAISAQTRHAIATHVRTVDELEVLLLLGRDDQRYWSAAAAASSTGLPHPAVGRVLEVLASRGLLDVRLSGEVLYRFDPATIETKKAADAILDAGSRQHAAVLRIILALPNRAITDFADAFKVNRGRNRG